MIASLKKKLYLFSAGYFRFWANLSLRRWQPRIIAVTGSVGKTTMLRLLEVQLGKRAHYSHNANSAFGIAFDIVGLRGVTGSKMRWLYLLAVVPFRSLWFRHRQEFYVVEIDGERPKETAFLAEWLRPEVTLWVSLGRSHAMYYDQQVANGEFPTVEEAIAHEFGYLPRYTTKLVIALADNPLMTRQLQDITATVETVRLADLVEYQVKPDRSCFTLHTGSVEFAHPMPKEIAVQLLMLERLVAYLGVLLTADFSSFQPAPGRNGCLRGIKGIQMIDSSYNAHLISMKSTLDMIQQMDVAHKWLVIGDMTEQGRGEAREHKRLGEHLAAIDAERYILVGRRVGAHTLPELQSAGFNDKTVHFAHAREALAYLKKELTGQEVVLFKGSQYLEWIEEKLLADPADIVKLPRQEPSAKKRRAAWGLQ